MSWIAVVALAAALSAPSGSAPRHSPAGVAELLEIAQAEREPEERRARAIRELEHTEVRTHLGVLRRLLREERSLDIRLSAACALAALGDRKAPKDLLLATAYDGTRTPNCSRSDVCLALGRLGEPAAVLHLERALQSPLPADEPYFYVDVCRALGMLGTADARRLLLVTLRDGSVEARHATIAPLTVVARDSRCPQGPGARAALATAARSDPEEKVAEQAASALFWGGVDGAAFWRLLESDPSPQVRTRAARVMDRHYLNAARLGRLRQAVAREKDPAVREALERTLGRQQPPSGSRQ